MQEAGFSLYPIFQRLYNLNLTVAGANVMPIVITMFADTACIPVQKWLVR